MNQLNNVLKTHELTIDISPQSRSNITTNTTFFSMDVNTGKKIINFTHENSPVDLTNATVLLGFEFVSVGTSKIIDSVDGSVVIEDAVNGQCSVMLPNHFYQYEGQVLVHVYIKYPDGRSLDAGIIVTEFSESWLDSELDEMADFYVRRFENLATEIKGRALEIRTGLEQELLELSEKLESIRNQLESGNVGSGTVPDMSEFKAEILTRLTAFEVGIGKKLETFKNDMMADDVLNDKILQSLKALEAEVTTIKERLLAEAKDATTNFGADLRAEVEASILALKEQVRAEIVARELEFTNLSDELKAQIGLLFEDLNTATEIKVALAELVQAIKEDFNDDVYEIMRVAEEIRAELETLRQSSTDTGWIDVSLTSGSVVERPVQVRKINSVVHLRGQLTDITELGLVLELPVDFAPTKAMVVTSPITGANGENAIFTADFKLDVDGKLTLIRTSNTDAFLPTFIYWLNLNFIASDETGIVPQIGLTDGNHSTNCECSDVHDEFRVKFVALQGQVDQLKAMDGIQGLPGTDGQDGIDGKSAFELAVANGFVGTLDEWLASLHGTDGNDSNGSNNIGHFVKSVPDANKAVMISNSTNLIQIAADLNNFEITEHGFIYIARGAGGRLELRLDGIMEHLSGASGWDESSGRLEVVPGMKITAIGTGVIPALNASNTVLTGQLWSAVFFPSTYEDIEFNDVVFSISENDTWIINGVDTERTTRGRQGIQGIQGKTGPVGPQGKQGEQGLPGLDSSTGQLVRMRPNIANAQVMSSSGAIDNIRTALLNFADIIVDGVVQKPGMIRINLRSAVSNGALWLNVFRNGESVYRIDGGWMGLTQVFDIAPGDIISTRGGAAASFTNATLDNTALEGRLATMAFMPIDYLNVGGQANV